MKPTTLREINQGAEEHEFLRGVIRGASFEGAPVRILEAGCGHYWPIDLGDTPRRITGVDQDVDALRIRRTDLGDLDEEILGDLRTADLPAGESDVVYCSFVLEHMEEAEAGLATMRRALRPGGFLIVKVPDGESVYGFLVKHSPHRIHVWYKRHVERKPHAGEPGHAPYPTVYEPVVSVRGLRAWAAENGFDVADAYFSNSYLKVFGAAEPLAQFAIRVIGWLSMGRLAASHNNIGFVMVKR